MDPLTIIYTAEVLSYSMRAKGLALYNGLCYGTGAFNTYAIPYAMEWFSWGFYMITALWCFLAELPIIYAYFPATERMSLEEIDVVFEGTRHDDLDIALNNILQGTPVHVEKGAKVDQVEKTG